MSGSRWFCMWSNLELQEGVRPSFLPVQCRCHPCVTGMTRTGAQKSGLISRQRRSWEKFAGKRQLLSQIFQHRDLTPEVSRCHASRVLITGSATWHGDTGPPWLWLPSLRWHWSLISPRPGSQLSELYIVGNYPAGIISPLSRDIVCLHSGHN